MKTFFVVLGLIITLSAIILLISLAGFVLTNWQVPVYVARMSFSVFVLAAIVFVVALLTSRHGKRTL